jgi:hypothetical protein
MKKENSKILIQEGKQIAEARLSELKQQAIRLTELIKVFNLQPVLRKIETAEEAKAFLTAPLDYFNERIISDCGMTFGSNKPNPEQVAAIFNIKYGAVVQKINSTRSKPSELQYFSVEEASGKIELMPEAEEAIREQSKIYLSDPEEIEEYLKVNELCKSLNEYCDRYNVNPVNKNMVPAALGIRCDPTGQDWIFKPDYRIIQKFLKHNN